MLAPAVLLLLAALLPQNPLPLQLEDVDPASGALRYSLEHAHIDALVGLGQAQLDGLLLPDGSLATLELERIEHERFEWGFHVDGQPRPGLLDSSSLSVWKGRLADKPGSDALLAFSHYGVHGWIDTGAELVHLVSRPAPGGDWTAADVLLVEEASLAAARAASPHDCVVLQQPSSSVTPAYSATNTNAPATLLAAACSLRTCTVSIESDFQFFQRFLNVNAQATYIASLWSFIADRFSAHASTALSFPYIGIYTTANDPWTTPDAPGSLPQMLDEFRLAWAGAIPGGGRLGHFMSGAMIGGGAAYLNTLASTSFNFGVSGNLDGLAAFPISQNPANWDFYVCAHELGHAFNAIHTHEYCPPIDRCESMQSPGPCQTSQVCTSGGTLMSYCAYCPGGAANITTQFHPVSAQDMTAAALANLPPSAQLSGSEPATAVPGQPTPVIAHVSGTPSGPVELVWRASAAMPWQRITMTSGGGGSFTASLPPFACSESPSFFYTFPSASCGTLHYPASAPATPLSLEVLSIATLVDDTFETDQGWIPASNGTTSGLWERGVPIFDPSNFLAPTSDGDGSGQCWVTANTPVSFSGAFVTGGGSVQLTSPPLDLSAAGTQVDLRYYFRSNDATSSDRYTVRMSQNGLAGPFAVVFFTTASSSAWRTLTILRDDILAAGLVPGPNMRLRVAVADLGVGASGAEGGLDGFRITTRTCQSGLGTRYCTALPNSTGAPAQISASGTASVVQNNLVLQAAPVPSNTSGMFLYGLQPSQTTFGNGIKCIASPIRRLPVTSSSGTTLAHAVNVNAGSAAGVILAGTTWHFQGWFRDNAAGGSGTNLSNGLRITFE